LRSRGIHSGEGLVSGISQSSEGGRDGMGRTALVKVNEMESFFHYEIEGEGHSNTRRQQTSNP